MKASRTRGFLNLSRRMLNAKACMRPLLRVGNSSLMTRFSATAGKLYDSAHSLAEFSVRQSALSPLNASSATVLSRR